MNHIAKLNSVFEANASEKNTQTKPKKKRPAPLSLRLNEAELDALRKAASGRSINGYVRERLFCGGDGLETSKAVSKDYEALARVLGALGRTDVFANLAAISLALEEQRLLVSIETETSVREACLLITEMRSNLLIALGLRKA